MMRQVCNRKGCLINPLRAILFLAAMLLFICTVVYRMLKSDSVGNAMATLIESLFIVASFIFLGIIIAYLVYFIHDRIRQGHPSNPAYGMLGRRSAEDKTTPKPDRSEMGLNSDEESESCSNS